MKATLYPLHLELPLGDPSRLRMSASQYLGFTAEDDVAKRLCACQLPACPARRASS